MSSLIERFRPAPRVSRRAGCFASRAGSVVTSLVLGAGLLASSVAAQPASPAAGEVIDPAECQVEPLSDEFLARLSGTPVSEASPSTEVAGSPAPFTEPEGEPAGDAEIEAVTMTTREIVACLNAGDYRRAYALYTENYLLRAFAGQSANLSQSTPVPNEAATQIALIGVTNVIVLEDGRVGARVELATGPDALQVLLYSVFARVDDRWLIDEETALDATEEGDTLTAGTPTG